MYTENFTEAHEVLGGIEPADHSSEQNTSRINVKDYRRIAVIVHAETGSGNTIDLDFEQADAASGGTLKSLDSGNKDVTVADASEFSVVEIRTEEFDTNNDFAWLVVEATPSAARIFGVTVLGVDPRYRPADTSNIDQLVTA